MHQISLDEKKIHTEQTAEPLRNCVMKWQYAKSTLKVQEVKCNRSLIVGTPVVLLKSSL